MWLGLSLSSGLGAQQPSADPPKPPETIRTLAACEAELLDAKESAIRSNAMRAQWEARATLLEASNELPKIEAQRKAQQPKIDVEPSKAGPK